MLKPGQIPAALLADFDSSGLDAVIATFNLHSSWPVNLTPICDYLNIGVRVGKLPPAFNAVSLVKVGGGSIKLVLSSRLDTPLLRATLGHELGHIFKHETGHAHASFDLEAALSHAAYTGCGGSLSKFVGGGNRLGREELEADLIGAYLTVPPDAMLELFQQGYDTAQVAACLELPPHFIELRAHLLIAQGY